VALEQCIAVSMHNVVMSFCQVVQLHMSLGELFMQRLDANVV